MQRNKLSILWKILKHLPHRCTLHALQWKTRALDPFGLFCSLELLLLLWILNAHMWSWHWVGCFWTLTYSGKCVNVESSLHCNFPVLRSNDFSVIAKHLLKSSILRVGLALSIWERCMRFHVGQWFIGSIHALPIASWNLKWLYWGVNPWSSWYPRYIM